MYINGTYSGSSPSVASEPRAQFREEFVQGVSNTQSILRGRAERAQAEAEQEFVSSVAAELEAGLGASIREEVSTALGAFDQRIFAVEDSMFILVEALIEGFEDDTETLPYDAIDDSTPKRKEFGGFR